MKTLIFLLLLAFFNIPLAAQYITITEVDESGNSRLLEGHRPAVDINSKLNIDINTPAINGEIDGLLMAGGSRAVDSLIATLNLYKTYIEKLNGALIQYALLFDSPGDSVDVTALRLALRERALAGQAIVRLFPEGSRFHRRREEELAFTSGKGSNENFRVIMRLLAEEMQFVEDDLAKLREEAGFYFQLAAWFVSDRGTEPLHLEGFDDIPPGEFFHYERNRLYLSPDQLSELESLNSFFEDMDKSNIFEKLADVIPGMLAKAIDIEGISVQLQEVKNKLNALVTTAKAEKDNILDQTRQIEAEFLHMVQNIKSLQVKYTSGEGAIGAASKTGLLRSFMDDVNGISSQVTALSDKIKDLVSSVDFNALGEGVSNVKSELIKLSSVLAREAINLVDHAREGYQMAVYGRQINTAALELSEKILKLSIHQIPSSTTVDLHYTGKRETGDLLVVKALIWKGDDAGPVASEVRDFPVMNALPHMHMSVVFAFAKPVTSETNWKGGPLVSILYKFKSHSLPYRNFLDPGIGLHAASYDFNNDDTPEFAGGVVASIFKDYLQFGWGFNFNANMGYWFAGLRIPIPTSPVSLMGTP